jgi:phosphomannomutase
MAGKMVPAIFGDVSDLELIGINLKHNGTFVHDPNPLIEANLAQLRQTVRDKQADLGVCFDGDADRLIIIDEQGRSIGCDLLTALMVPYFLAKNPGSAIVYDLRSSHVVPEEIIKHGGTPRRERVGHAFMKKTLRDSHACFGGELSGHFYYSDNYYADSGMITLVHVLNILGAADRPMSQLIAPLRRYPSSGEINFEVENKTAVMKDLTRKYSEGQIDDLDGVTIQFKDWWFNVRPSNTEPLLRLNVEAKTEEMLKERLTELKDFLGQPVDH